MIRVENLKKAYGAIEALRGISFEVQAGEIVGLLGPNGAGKSTTIKILTGFLHPDDGVVEIDNLDVLSNVLEVQSRIGYLSENTPLYPNLSVQSYLKLMADMRGIPRNDQRQLISEAIHATGMEPYLTRPIAKLSKGLRQRVGLAQAILHKPKLLILDEPTIGLDPTQIVEIRHLIRRLSEHSTILFSSHILSEVEALCDRVVIVINGHLRADAHLDELSKTDDVVVVLQEDDVSVAAALADVPGALQVEAFTSIDGYPAYRVRGSDDIAPKIYELTRQQPWRMREIRRDVVTLETVFNQLATAKFEDIADASGQATTMDETTVEEVSDEQGAIANP